MKSFLLDPSNKPVIKWGLLKDGIHFEGCLPNGYSRAVAPSGNIVILDIDKKRNKDGFNYIPIHILEELLNTFNYNTKSGGSHCFINYTGSKMLLNRATEYGLDLRIAARNGNCGGYVKYYYSKDIRECEHLIKDSSLELNEFLESLFSYE